MALRFRHRFARPAFWAGELVAEHAPCASAESPTDAAAELASDARGTSDMGTTLALYTNHGPQTGPTQVPHRLGPPPTPPRPASVHVRPLAEQDQLARAGITTDFEGWRAMAQDREASCGARTSTAWPSTRPRPREAEAAEAAEAAAEAAATEEEEEEEAGPTLWCPSTPPPEGWAFPGAPEFVCQGSYQFEDDVYTGRWPPPPPVRDTPH